MLSEWCVLLQVHTNHFTAIEAHSSMPESPLLQLSSCALPLTHTSLACSTWQLLQDLSLSAIQAYHHITKMPKAVMTGSCEGSNSAVQIQQFGVFDARCLQLHTLQAPLQAPTIVQLLTVALCVLKLKSCSTPSRPAA
jgi:hypothetical protein